MLEQLHSFAGTHAIESATISIGWTPDGVDVKLLEAFSGLASEFREWGFPSCLPVSMIKFEYSNQVASTTQQQVVGYAFQKLGPTNNIRREVSLRDNQLVILVADYQRWDQLWAEITPIVTRLLNLLNEHQKRISRVSLQYLDRFTWRSTSQAFPTKEVLQNSCFLPIDLFANSPQWHSNQGFFVSSSVPNAGMRLDNVVVTLGIEGQFPSLTLALVHQYSNFTEHSGITEFASLMPLMQEAHDTNKDYLTQLLTSAVCAKINLSIQ